MRALLSKQEEPKIYRSTGNYYSHVLGINLPTPEKRPKVHFALFLKTRISTNEAYISSSSFFSSFQSFFAEIWQECCPLMWQKTCQGIYIFGLLRK